MRDEIRRAVVSTAWKKLKGENPSNLYCFTTRTSANMSNGYDYSIRAHYTDSYHYGTCANYSVSSNGSQFSGYDYDSGSNFSGSINGNNIQLHAGGSHFNYIV
jgi:hypothetical protein